VVASQRIDAAAPGAMTLAVDKAYTAVRCGADRRVHGQHPAGRRRLGFNTTSGGVVAPPAACRCSRAVRWWRLGVSGGTGEQDEACARAVVSPPASADRETVAAAEVKRGQTRILTTKSLRLEAGLWRRQPAGAAAVACAVILASSSGAVPVPVRTRRPPPACTP
jgi:hypothetical protein